MNYPFEKFDDVDIGEVFKLYPGSNLTYEKTNETDAKCEQAEFYIQVDKEQVVTVIAPS